MMSTQSIFEPTLLGGINLKNRIIRSATHEGMADENGIPNEQLQNTYVQLAKGEVGAIITGYAGIRQDGKSPLYRMLMIDHDMCIDAYRKIVDAVHAYKTSIILQIAHSGRQTRSKITGKQPVAPSAIRDKFYNEDIPKELTESEIQEIINGFVKAIIRAKQAGFDGVQLHVAHGYLLSQFLSPYMNRRQDSWGGTTENRFRIIHEIFSSARQQVGAYPIWVKLNAHDGRKNGMRVEEAVKIAALLEQSGCNAIEVSCGVVEDGFYSARSASLPIVPALQHTFKFKSLPSWIKWFAKISANIIMPPVKPLNNYNVPAAQMIKAHVSIPVIVVGGITSLRDISEILEQKQADCVSMCRPFILEPGIVKKFQEGKEDTARCIHCNYCMVLTEERPLRCYYGKLKD